jgi:hypothetical protein
MISREAHQKNRKDGPADGVGATAGETSQRDGREAGSFTTERRGRKTLKGHEAKPHERRPVSICPRQTRAAIGGAGDERLCGAEPTAPRR